MIASYILVAFIAFMVGATIGGCYFDTFRIGAEWMQKKMIEKATQWLFATTYDYLNEKDQEKVAEFVKAMEENYDTTRLQD